MSIIQAFFLGILQGLTEFLPISSSGHLVLVPYFLKWQIPENEAFLFGVLVQLGTLIAVIAYFWKDLLSIASVTVSALWNPSKFSDENVRTGVYILIGTIPAALFGFLFKSTIESAFANPRYTAVFLLVTAALLVLAEKIPNNHKTVEKLTLQDALWIGAFQALALFAGVSRSGATIAGGMTRKLDRSSAAHFSVLLAVPIMIGAGIYTALDVISLPNPNGFLTPLLVGFISSTIGGFFAI
ncbi:MAG: undecaprenyl-diphosphate phosphatase, partial [Chloroflexota bacterium]